MNFIRKHYEKIFLIFLLVLFLCLLAYQAFSIWSEKSKKPEDKLNLKPPRADYVAINEKENFSVLEKIAASTTQLGSERTCFYPPKLVKCPMSEGTLVHFIPPEDVTKARKCSYCGKEIVMGRRPGSRGGVRTLAGGTDSDGDGIPDAEEKRLGLNPNEKQDGSADLDEDGFTNAEEFLNHTDPKDPKSRPSYAKKLYFSSIITKSLDMKLLPYAQDGEKIDPKKWEIQIVVDVIKRRKKRKETKFLYLGDKFYVGTGKHRIEYFLESIEPDFRYNENTGNRENHSRLTLVRKDPKQTIRLICEPGKDILHPKKNVRFVLNIAIKHDTDISAFVGESFTIGSDRCGRETFTVLSISEDGTAVTIQGENEKYEIESDKKMPQTGRGDDMMMPPTDGPGF